MVTNLLYESQSGGVKFSFERLLLALVLPDYLTHPGLYVVLAMLESVDIEGPTSTPRMVHVRFDGCCRIPAAGSPRKQRRSGVATIPTAC